MAKTKYIKDKTGKFAGSIGVGKTKVPSIATAPVKPTLDEKETAQNIFDRIPDMAEKVEATIAKQRQGRHNPFVPVSLGQYASAESLEVDPDQYAHQRAAYAKPCPGCGTEDRSIRYRSGTNTYCYDCASHNALKQRSKANNWEEVCAKEEFLQWRRSQKRVCYYCGIPESDVHKQGVKNTRAGGNMPEALGNDRWDSNKPYVISNLVLSCFACNQLKSNTMTGDEFMEYFAEACSRRSRDMVERYKTAHQWCCPSENETPGVATGETVTAY